MSVKLSSLCTAAVLATICSTTAWSQEPENSYFYQQLLADSSLNSPSSTLSSREQNLLDRIARQDFPQHVMGLSRQQADNLVFNTLWLEQHNEDYDSRQGGAALGKLFRMGIKTIYLGSQNQLETGYDKVKDDAIVGHRGDLGYRFRLTEEKVSMAIEYDF